MAMMISWVAPVNPSHPYLENDRPRRLTPTICAFHLGFSLGTLSGACRFRNGPVSSVSFGICESSLKSLRQSLTAISYLERNCHISLLIDIDVRWGRKPNPAAFEYVEARHLSRREAKPIPRWDVHFGGLEDDRKVSTAPHITFRPQLGGHRQCGLAICTFHLGFSLGNM